MQMDVLLTPVALIRKIEITMSTNHKLNQTHVYM